MGIDVEKLAREAGFDDNDIPGLWVADDGQLWKFSALVLEEAAKVRESQAERFTQGSPLEGNKPYAAHECAAAIRALAKGVE